MISPIETKSWWHQLRGSILSFKVISFVTVCFMLVLFWVSLVDIYKYTFVVVKELSIASVLDPNGAKEVILNCQKILFDQTVSHIVVAFSAVIGAIITLKGVQYYIKGNESTELLKQADTSSSTVAELKKVLPSNFGVVDG